MPTLNLGRVGFVNKGTWLISTAYKINDTVTYLGGTYACLIANTGQTPVLGGTIYWQEWIANNVVHTTGDETIGGIKTFSLSPIIPDATTAFQPLTFGQFSVKLATDIHAAPSKVTPIDADEVGIWDSVSGLLNRVTGTNWKAYFKTYFDSLYLPITTQISGGIRQTVQNSSVDTNGYANFISIGTGLAVNIAATAIPLKISAAGGNVSSDRLGTISADTSITGLTASTTNYLFAEVALNGIVTLGKTVLKPLYQQGGAASITLNQYTFNISEMKMYVGNGTTATQVYGVFIGNAVTNATNVTSVVNYALNGTFVTPTSALLVAATITTLNHNLGMKGICIPILTCLTAQAGYAAGDELPFNIVNSGGAYSSAWSYNEYTASYATIAATLYLVHLGTAAFTTITPANFNVNSK